MLKKKALFLCLIFIFFFFSPIYRAQGQPLCTGSLGDPIVNITFGNGNNPGPTLSTIVPGASTTSTFVSVTGNPAIPTPIDGEYTITNNVPLNGNWFYSQSDHTSGDVNGYMAFFNASEIPGEFYKQQVNGLCDNTTYEFAAWIANVLNPAMLIGVKPDITFRIEKADGTLIASYSTGPIGQNNTMTWQQFGFFFTTPAGVNTVVLKMTNANPGGNAMPGNDLAIDDITFRPCGPVLTSSFDPTISQITKSQCGFTPVDLFGTVSSGYTNPAFLWQVSTNSGTSWIDITGVNSLNFTYTPIAANTYWFRTLSAETNSINSPSCRVISNTIKLTIYDLPQATFTGNTICEGDQAQLSLNATIGKAAFDIIYNDGITNIPRTGLPMTSTFPVSPNISATKSYTLISMTDANGCSTSNFINPIATVTVTPKPLVTITGNNSLCSGDSMQLNATGASTFNWSPSSGLNNSNIGNPIVSPNVSTRYIVIGTTNGCSVKDSIDIAVNPRPVIIKINDTTICKNSSVQLFAGGGVSYDWSPSSSLSNTSTSNPVATPPANITYYVTVTGGNNCQNTDSIKVNIRPDPVFAINSPKNICENASTQLSASGGDLYSWQPVNSLNNSSIQNPTASPQTTTAYFVQIADTVCNNTFTLSTTITVLRLPIVKANKSNDIDCSNDQSQLMATGATQYTWSPTPTLSNATVANPMASPTITTQYIVKGSDQYGCINYDSVTVNVTDINKGGYLMPTAFTPNNDGINDCYRIRFWGVIKELDFSIYNRWGERVFHTTNPTECWNGTYKGLPQDAAVFIYMIKAKTFCENNVFRKGTFVLIR